MLKKVTNPGGREIAFYYDPLGRRTAKIIQNKINRYIWDGNVLLHEWSYEGRYPPKKAIDEDGIKEEKEPVENLITWIYEDGSFVPCAKIDGDEKYSIVSDYIGTPTHAYNAAGSLVWERELDIYGATREQKGKDSFIPYLYQGQYVDEETGLAYNRFRYYDNESGNYLSQDPIGLWGGNPTLYSYVIDTNLWIDSLGLKGDYGQIPVMTSHQRHHVIPQSMANHPAIKNSGYDVHSHSNIVQLPTSTPVDPSKAVHRGMHNKAYDDMIRQRLNEIDSLKASPAIKRMHIQALSDDVADDLRNKRIQLNNAH